MKLALEIKIIRNITKITTMTLTNVISRLKFTSFSPAVTKSIQTFITNCYNRLATAKHLLQETTVVTHALKFTAYFSVVLNPQKRKQTSRYSLVISEKLIERGSGRKNITPDQTKGHLLAI